MFTPADRDLANLAAAQHSIFDLGDARRMGLTHAQIDVRVRDCWVAVHEGVFRMPGAAATTKGDLLAACRAAAPPVAVSHRAAAELYELPGRQPDLVEITCRRWNRSQREGIVVHESTRFAPEDITQIDGIPVCRPERVVLELAGLRPHPNYIEAVIHAARRKRLITYESTIASFARLARRGVPGVGAMRVALERWDPSRAATESEMETRLLHTLRAHDLPEPVLQYQVHDDNGLFVARVDAALPQWSIIIEYDSKQEHSDEFQIARDARRRNEIMTAGFWPITARYDDLRGGGHLLVDQIRRLAQRSA